MPVAWLIIVSVILTVMVLVASLYFLVYFRQNCIRTRVIFGLAVFHAVWCCAESEHDKNCAWAPKVAVVFGLAMACFVVLLLPLDVANRSSGGLLDMEALYQAMYMMIACMVIVIVPFMIFYYEAYDPDSDEPQWCTALKYQSVTMIAASLTISLMWLYMGYAQVDLCSSANSGADGMWTGGGGSTGAGPGPTLWWLHLFCVALSRG